MDQTSIAVSIGVIDFYDSHMRRIRFSPALPTGGVGGAEQNIRYSCVFKPIY